MPLIVKLYPNVELLRYEERKCILGLMKDGNINSEPY